MICLLNNKANNNEEYRAVVKSRIRLFSVLILLGIFTLCFGLSNEIFQFMSERDWLNGLYIGFGTSLIVVGAIKISKFRKLLKNETQLKAERLKNNDERNIMISLQATKAAMLIVMIFSYVAVIISGFFSKVIFYCFWSVIMVFIISYYSISAYLNKKL